MTGPRERLDQLDAAHAEWSKGTWGGAVDALYTLPSSIPALVSALRAVADLADELDRQAASYVLSAPGSHDDGMRKAFADDARRLRAALAPLAAPDTGGER